MRLSLEHMQLSDLPDVMSPLSSWPAISPHSSLYTTPGSRGDEEKVFPPSLIVNELEISQTMNALMHIKETPSKFQHYALCKFLILTCHVSINLSYGLSHINCKNV